MWCRALEKSPMIKVDNLTKRFGRFTAVQDLSFRVDGARALALWGPNGAGKTTVLKCMLGLLRYEGHIAVDNLDLHTDGRTARRLLGYVPQELAFYDDLNLVETAQFFARLRHLPVAVVDDALAQVDLTVHRHKLVRELSGGMKQRLALALALLGDPPVLILDEPTSSLDTGSRGQFLRLLLQVKSAGKTVVFTSHRLDEVEALADQVLVMEHGQAKFTCAADQVATRLNLTTQVRLLIADPQIDPAIAVLHAEGYAAHRNGTGILVQVAPDAKAGPIHSLTRANIHVTDFELE
jgi:ABC-type multidrug transport system ATPase subunit